MFVIKYQKFFLSLAGLFVLVSFALIIKFGLPLGIDFKGGSELQVTYPSSRPDTSMIKDVLAQNNLSDATIQPSGERGVIIKSRAIDETQKNQIVQAMGQGVSESSFTTIGPSVGRELKKKAIISVVLSLIAIILFVAYAFRKVSRPVSSWKFGLAVIIPLIHDVIIPIGAFAVLGHLYGVELDTLFVVAILTTLSLSIADTIVVFDRIREHLANDANHKVPFPELVGQSLQETFGRSINTSLMVLVMVVTLAIVGPSSTRLFATVLAIGMFFGTYSSIFIASPILVLFEKMQHKQK